MRVSFILRDAAAASDSVRAGTQGRAGAKIGRRTQPGRHGFGMRALGSTVDNSGNSEKRRWYGH